MKGKKIRKSLACLMAVFMQSLILGQIPTMVAHASSTGLTVSVTDSSNQSIPQYTNNGGTAANKILSPEVRLAADATAKISYNFTGVSFSKYKFVQANDLNTLPQFPQDSAMTNIDLPAPNTQPAYANDLGPQGTITTKQYNYAGNPSLTSSTGSAQITRDVSFGNPLGNGVLIQNATVGNDLPAPSVSSSNAFLNDTTAYDQGQSTKDTTHYVKASWDGKYYRPIKNAAWKAMKLWGYFAPQRTGSYNLAAFSDDGAYGYLIVNGVKQVFVNDWTIAAANNRTTNNKLNLEAGKYYPIYMEWYEGCPTNAAFIPRYQYNGGSFVNIPQNEFYSSNTTTPGEVAGAYFGDISGIKFPAQDGIYYMATKFISMEGTTSGLYGPFIIDNTKPVITNLAVTSNNANGNKWGVAGNILTVKFTASENLSSNPQILINGYAANSTITKDSQNNYTATVSIGSDSSINSIGDKLTDGPITATVGHYSDLSGNEGDAVQDSTVTYDNTAPTVAISYSSNPTSVGTDIVTAVYSEPVKSGETPQISINQPGTTDITSQNMTVVGTDRKTWSYNYTVNADNGGTYKDGTATVSLSTAHDAAGNTAAAPTGNTFTINTKAPTVTLVFSANPVSVGTETITATYSKPVKSGETPQISINQQGSADITSQNMTVGQDRTIWTYNYTVNADNGSTYKDGTATVTLSMVHDALGNAAAAPQVNTFTIDTKAPAVAITYSANPTNAGTELITATYSEPIKAGEIPEISIVQQGTASITLQPMTAVGTDRTTWSYNYTVSVDNGSTYKDGTAIASLSTVHDVAGNAASAPTGNTFTIDTIAPTATIGAPSAALTNGGPIIYTVTYSGADRVTLNSSNVSLVKTGTADGTVTESGTGNTRTVTVSNITGDGTLGIRIAAGTASDNAGNSALAPSDSATFMVCNTGPVITLTPSTTNWTNADVTVTVSASAVGNGNGIASIKWLIGTKTAADFAGAAGTVISGSTFTASSNGVYTVYAKDNLGNESVQTINITNIDIIAPTLTLTQTPATVTNGNVTINVNAADSGSGVAATKWASGDQTISYVATGGTVLSASTFTVAANGTYTVYTVDNAGNGAIQTITVSNIDTVAPTINLTATPTTPTNQNVTINADVTDSGSGVAAKKWASGNQTLSYFTTGGTVLSSATFTVETNGVYTVYAVDNAGNAAVQTITVSNIDKTAPIAPAITAPTDGTVTKNNTPVISGTGEKGATVTVYDNGTIIGTAKVDDNGSWSLTPSTALVDGEHIITATQTDAAGNVSPSSNTVNLTVDTTVSSPVITSPASGVTNNNKPTIRGTGEVGATVTVYDGTTVIGTATVQSDNAWSLALTTALTDGAHAIIAKQVDVAGNESGVSNTVNLTVDTTVSAPVITSPASGVTNNNKPTIRGTGEAGATVTVYDGTTVIGTATVQSDNAWSLALTTALTDGAHAITAKQVDVAGNESGVSNTVNLTIDTAVPAAPVITAPADGTVTNNNRPTITGTGEAGATVTVYDGTISIGMVTVESNGKWSLTPATALIDGAHAIAATQSDAAGNVSGKSNIVNLIVNTTPSTVVKKGIFLNGKLLDVDISVVKSLSVNIGIGIKTVFNGQSVKLQINRDSNNINIVNNAFDLYEVTDENNFTLKKVNTNAITATVVGNTDGQEFTIPMDANTVPIGYKYYLLVFKMKASRNATLGEVTGNTIKINSQIPLDKDGNPFNFDFTIEELPTLQ